MFILTLQGWYVLYVKDQEDTKKSIVIMTPLKSYRDAYEDDNDEFVTKCDKFALISCDWNIQVLLYVLLLSCCVGILLEVFKYCIWLLVWLMNLPIRLKFWNHGGFSSLPKCLIFHFSSKFRFFKSF